jgi:branched-chain amino acid transport system substrate-binding protein
MKPLIQPPLKTSKPVPPIVPITLAIVLMSSAFWLWQRQSSTNWSAASSHSSDTEASTQDSSSTTEIPLSDRFSIGKRLLIASAATPTKEIAVAAWQQNDFRTAQTQFQAALREKRNDPEARIYWNNVQAIRHPNIKLAVTVPLRTDLALSEEVLRGVAQAQEEINQAGGSKGRHLVIEIASDDNDPAIAQTIARDLVERSDVLGVVGHIASGVTLATAPIYDQGNLVAISPISSAVQLSDKSRYVFRTVPSDAIAARALADYGIANLKRKTAIVYFNSQSDYSNSLKKEFSTSLSLAGGQVLAEVDLSDPNFSASVSLENGIRQGADMIVLASNTSRLDQALQVVQVNRRRLPILGGDDVYGAKTVQVSGENGLGMVVAVPWHRSTNPETPFLNQARNLWGGEVSWRTVTAYDAVQAFRLSLDQTSNREGIRAELAQPGFQAKGASQSVRFMPSGDRNAPVQLVRIVKTGQSGYDFAP